MDENKRGCCGSTSEQEACTDGVARETSGGATAKVTPGLIDHKVTLLISAGAAIAAGCEPCLTKIVAGLKDAGVGATDIRRAVEIGQLVKDKPAANMKVLADTLTGTSLAEDAPAGPCPLDHGK